MTHTLQGGQVGEAFVFCLYAWEVVPGALLKRAHECIWRGEVPGFSILVRCHRGCQRRVLSTSVHRSTLTTLCFIISKDPMFHLRVAGFLFNRLFSHL
jgi:hypothetical protein